MVCEFWKKKFFFPGEMKWIPSSAGEMSGVIYVLLFGMCTFAEKCGIGMSNQKCRSTFAESDFGVSCSLLKLFSIWYKANAWMCATRSCALRTHFWEHQRTFGKMVLRPATSRTLTSGLCTNGSACSLIALPSYSVKFLNVKS